MEHAKIDLDRLYKGYFDIKKPWCFRIYKLLIANQVISRKQFEAVHVNKYFVRDQLERMATLGIVKVTHRDPHKRKPTLFKSNIHQEEAKE